MIDNLLLLTDSYKLTHWKQYPPLTETVYSYFESRGGVYPSTVFFGLQYIIAKYLEGRVITLPMIHEAEQFVNQHIGPGYFNREGWMYIAEKLEGKLPIRIKAVPEGTIVPNHNVLMTIENTDPKCFWLTNYLETLLVQVWYGCTVATQSRAIKQDILSFLRETGTPELIDFKLHDFGFRGVSSVESAAVGGAAHLLNFQGTDTIAGILLAQAYYTDQEADSGTKMYGYSIPAAEHSTITSWGRENELDAMRNMLEQYPKGLVACVSDSFNIYEACEKIWGGTLKDQVLKREGCVVVRPDSGDPSTVVLKVLDILGDKLGFTVNSKGYKVLDPHVRVIQGDGVNHQEIVKILQNMKEAGWSADNIAFGMGGALLQKLHRDTQKFAFKCSSVTVNDIQEDVYKEPVTDTGKNSKRGRLKLVKVNNSYLTVAPIEPFHNEPDQLQTVFENGFFTQTTTFDECRERAKQGL